MSSVLHGVVPRAPGIGVLRHYKREWLRGDVIAGVTVATYLIPQVMAYAGVAGLPPATGLWAAIGPLAIYALLGSSRQVSIGPESTTALLTAVALGPLAAGDSARYESLAVVLALLVGGVCVLGWLARLGFLSDLLSKPVLTGYLAGVAVIMITSQLKKLTGVPVRGDSFVPEARSFLSQLDQVHWPTVLLSAGVLAFLLLAARLKPHVPGPLIGMLLATFVVYVFSLQNHGIAVVGDFSAGVLRPSVHGLSLHDVSHLILPAIGIAIVGFSDDILTARAFADRRGETIDANQELLALGAANWSAGALHGFPISSSGSRTAIGVATGSRTQLYSLVCLAAVLVTVLAARPLLAAFPLAALGALVVYAALTLIDIPELRRFAAFRRSELALALATTAAVLGLGVLQGVLVAVGLSILDLFRRLARPHDGILGQVPGLAGMHDIDDYADATLIPGLIVYRYDAPLCFANAEDFRRRALASLTVDKCPPRWFLLNAEANVEVDITAVDALEKLRCQLNTRGIVFAMARVKQELRDNLAAAGLADKIGADRIFVTLPTAVEAYQRWTVQAGRHDQTEKI